MRDTTSESEHVTNLFFPSCSDCISPKCLSQVDTPSITLSHRNHRPQETFGCHPFGLHRFQSFHLDRGAGLFCSPFGGGSPAHRSQEVGNERIQPRDTGWSGSWFHRRMLVNDCLPSIWMFFFGCFKNIGISKLNGKIELPVGGCLLSTLTTCVIDVTMSCPKSPDRESNLVTTKK